MMNRRGFLEFLGHASALGAAATLTPRFSFAQMLQGAHSLGIKPTSADDLILAPGLSSQVLIKWDDPLDALGNLRFGFNSDFTAFVPFAGNPEEGMLWVNHEYASALFIHGHTDAASKSLSQLEKEMRAVGGSLVHVRQDGDTWRVIFDSPYNRRLDAFTPIPFSGSDKIDGSSLAYGTLANCAGGVTPWGNILTCEENYQTAFGEYKYDYNGNRTLEIDPKGDQWQRFFGRSPEQYGWVVEVNPLTGEAKKLVSLGRFGHEGATTTVAPDGRCVVYMGDDANNECIYKFVSDSATSLESGELFVADTFSGRWKSLNLRRSRELQGYFTSQVAVQLRVREAARIVGGTPQDRPEDIKIDPITGAVIVALTNNKSKNNLHGGLLKIEEDNGDPRSERFTASMFMMGGENSGFSCPDNLAFDRSGHLWMTSDISSSSLGKGDYAPFLNNGLFVIPTSGANAGKVIQVASAPVEAEFTGPSFSPDGKTMFLSVQHPGEETQSLTQLTSTWPDGGGLIPRSAVVAIRGPLLDNPGA